MKNLAASSMAMVGAQESVHLPRASRLKERRVILLVPAFGSGVGYLTGFPVLHKFVQVQLLERALRKLASYELDN